MTKKTLCFVCKEPAGRRENDIRKILRCDSCGGPLCDMCAVYGADNLPRCGEHHFEYGMEEYRTI
jgi:hypothetical protein